MICFYHLDDDGKCAANLVHRFGVHDSHEDQFIEMNYGFDVPFDRITADEKIYIVDFSLDSSDMKRLYEDFTADITWIDHHKSVIDKYADFPYEIKGIRSNDYSGCMLTYLYLTNNIHLLNESYTDMIGKADVPFIVQLCDDYDMWRFRLEITKEFHEGFSTIPHGPTEDIWSKADVGTIHQIASNGNAIIAYRSNLMSKLVKSYGYESELDGHKCFVLNQGLVGSDDFATISEDYDFFVGYIFNGEKYSYSLRSKDSGPDVSAIAVKFGGGGHVHAAGCNSTEMIVPKVES